MRSAAHAIAIAALSLLAAGSSAVHAQGYPARPVTMVVPYPPGGATDIIGRVLAQSLSERLGQQVVVDNRAGAGGNVGAELVSRAKPDGYTLLMGAFTSHSINATLQAATARFDLEKNFAPIAIVGHVPLVLVVNPSVQAKTLKDYIALAKAKPGETSVASAGNGSPQHLAAEMFQLQTGTKLLHVPYKGSGPAMTDLVGGQVQSMIETVPAAIVHIRSGKLRPIVVTTPQRVPSLPEVPTMAEGGLPGFEVTSMFGVAAPAGTPQPIVDRLNAELAAVLKLPKVRETLAEQGVVSTHTSPDQAAVLIRAEVAKWAKVIKEAHVKID